MNDLDLSKCSPNDQLFTRHGICLRYVGPTKDKTRGDHFVKYPDRSIGQRWNDGTVFKGRRVAAFDEDIMYIIPAKDAPITDRNPEKKSRKS